MNDLSIVFDPRGGGGEDVAVLVVVVGVDENLECVGLLEHSVAPPLGRDNRRGLRIEADDRKIDGVLGVTDAGFRGLGGGKPLLRELLNEIPGRFEGQPVFVHTPVEQWWRVQSVGLDGSYGRRRLTLSSQQRGRRSQLRGS